MGDGLMSMRGLVVEVVDVEDLAMLLPGRELGSDEGEGSQLWELSRDWSRDLTG